MNQILEDLIARRYRAVEAQIEVCLDRQSDPKARREAHLLAAELHGMVAEEELKIGWPSSAVVNFVEQGQAYGLAGDIPKARDAYRRALEHIDLPDLRDLVNSKIERLG